MTTNITYPGLRTKILNHGQQLCFIIYKDFQNQQQMICISIISIYIYICIVIVVEG